VARLEEKLRAVIEAGRRLAAHGGAYDVVEANTKERGEVEAALKAARSSTKAASPRSGATQRHTDAALVRPSPLAAAAAAAAAAAIVVTPPSHEQAEKARVKELAQQSMSAAGWTSALLQGEENRFAKADEGAVESQLAAATVGLVSSAAFREKREELEAAAGAKREREAEEAAEAAAAQQARKRAKKREREKQQQRGLSFAADEEDG